MSFKYTWHSEYLGGRFLPNRFPLKLCPIQVIALVWTESFGPYCFQQCSLLGSYQSHDNKTDCSRAEDEWYLTFLPVGHTSNVTIEAIHVAVYNKRTFLSYFQEQSELHYLFSSCLYLCSTLPFCSASLLDCPLLFSIRVGVIWWSYRSVSLHWLCGDQWSHCLSLCDYV